ncbi:MAG: alkaline phosphatase family protein [Pseudomonadota bacterium]
MKAASPKVLAIGLDAADMAFFSAHRERLPTISGFLDAAAVAELASEPMAGSVWPTFLSGVTPDRHGIYHHMQWDPARMAVRRTHPDWIEPQRPFWRDMAREGCRVLVFDVPFAFRADTGGAQEIANWGSHDLVEDFWASDRALAREVQSAAREHPMGFEVPVYKTRDQLAAMAIPMAEGARLKAELAVRLLRESTPDLCIIIFGEVHRGGHLLWPASWSDAPQDALLSVYAALDEAVATLLATASDDTDVVLFALHGMAANQSQSHLSRAMLAAAETGGQVQAKAPRDTGIVRLLRRTVPAGLQHWIADHVPRAVRDYVVRRDLSGGYDWARTAAISLEGDVSGYWRLNVEGRERQGHLRPEAHRARVQSYAEAFEGFTTEEGDRLVQAVHFPALDGAGEQAWLLPDLLIEWNDDLPPLESARHPALGRVTGRIATGRSGNHRFRGFVAHRGPGRETVPLPGHIKDLSRLLEALTERATH